MTNLARRSMFASKLKLYMPATIFLIFTPAFDQLELSTKSLGITAFTAHDGLYLYRCLSYSKSSTAEVFQQILAQHVNRLNGVHSLANYIIVFAPTRADHNAVLKAGLQRLDKYNLKLSLKKYENFKEASRNFLIDIIRKRSTARPKEISTLVNSTLPKTESEVRSLLRTANHSGNLAEILQQQLNR